MKLSVLGSTSAGNCYIIENDTEALIIEAGVHLNLVKQALNFNIRKVVGVLVSHLHGDHSGKGNSLKEFEKLFPIYCNDSVIEAKGLNKAIEISHFKKFKVGDFTILPLSVEHDVPTLSFIIKHKKMGTLLFATDTCTFDYEIKGVNHILIECNYSDEVLTKSVENGLHPYVANRVKGSHMELQTTKSVLEAQDLSNVYNIVLLHLSDKNSDPGHFKDVLSKATGKPIQIAEKGLELEITNKPF